MTTLPPNYRILSSKWLETNPLPEDAMLQLDDGELVASSFRGEMALAADLRDGTVYLTARTDLPREAYADDEIRPMTHEERKALDEFTMAELRSEPGAEVASERTEAPAVSAFAFPYDDPELYKAASFVYEWFAKRGSENWEFANLASRKLVSWFRERAQENTATIATLRAQLEAKEAECRELREENAVLKSQVENADVNLEQVHLAQKGIWRTKVESAESRISELESQNDKLRAEVEESAYRFMNERNSLTAELDAVRKELRNRDESIAAKRKYVEKCNHLPELVIDSESGPICCECWAIEEKSRADKWQTILEANNDLMPTGVNFYFCVEEFFRQVRGMWNEQMDVLRNCGTAIVKAESERDAAQARCGALERALRNLDTAIADTFWISDDGNTQRPGTPEDGDVGEKLEKAWAEARSLLTPAQQPDNLEGGDEPCAPQVINCNAPVVGRDQVQMITTQQDAQSTESASNPQPESPIPSGVGQPSRPEPVRPRVALPPGHYPDSLENPVEFGEGPPEPVKAGEVGLDYSGKCRVYYHDYENGVWASRWEPHDWVISYTGRTRMCRNCRNGEVIPSPPIAPEGKATEGEG